MPKPKKDDLLADLQQYQTEGLKWVCRQSMTGRGLRLHQIASREYWEEAADTPAEAITKFLERQKVADDQHGQTS